MSDDVELFLPYLKFCLLTFFSKSHKTILKLQLDFTYSFSNGCLLRPFFVSATVLCTERVYFKLALWLCKVFGQICFQSGSLQEIDCTPTGNERKFNGGPIYNGVGNGNLLQYSCLGIPWTEEPGGLQSIGFPRVGYYWNNFACTHYLQKVWTGLRTAQRDNQAL